ncbi:MAG: hypothetical protein HPY53_03490 [Brevinematales bacterium]|nr:hypothetical protein [Brevinematales bacterium]
MAASKNEMPKKPNMENYLKEIEVKAYQIYQERKKNNIPGDQFTDWVQAENEIKSKYNIG